MSNIVIVGVQSAGLTAAAAVRIRDRSAKVIIIEKRPYGTYHPCGLPFAIGGDVADIQDLVEQGPRTPGVEVKLSTEARAIDTDAKVIEVVDLNTGREEKLSYDSLVLATGGIAAKPPIPGVDLGNVFTLRTISDGEKIISALPKAKKAVIVGAGPIGIETASALSKRGLDVTMVEMLPNVFPGMLDQDMSDVISERLVQAGIKVKCCQPVQEIRGGQSVSSVALQDEEIAADLVVLASGVKADVGLAAKAGLKLGPTKLIAVNDNLRTSATDVYAAGDCAEARDLITGRPTRSQIATTAIRMGKVAGINAAGGNEIFSGVLNTVVSSAHGLEVAATGLTTLAAKAVGIDVIAGRVRALTKPHYFPGAEPILVKLVVDKGSRKVIGGQIIGDGAAERANAVAVAITKGTTVGELSRIDYCYAPPFNDVIEPLTIAADALLRRL